MSEKRFKLSKWCGMANHSCILDGDRGLMLQGEVVDLLNEQQELINSMVEQHKARLDKLIEENGKLRMKIVELEKGLKE